MTDQAFEKDKNMATIGSFKTVSVIDTSHSSGKKPRYNTKDTLENASGFLRDHCGPHFQPPSNVNDVNSDFRSKPDDENHDMELDEGFIPARKPVKPRTPLPPTPVQTTNHYSVLKEASEEHLPHESSKPYKPGTLFIYCKTAKYQLTQNLYKLTKDPIRITHNSEGIIVYAKTQVDQAALITFCQTNKIDYATQRSKHEQPLKVIIRKLPIDTPTSDIQIALTELKFNVQKVCQLSGKDKNTGDRVPYPLFLVHLKKTPGVSEIYNIDGLLYFKVTIEPYQNTTITQCYRCQRYGHVQTSCCATPRCVRCGEQHRTEACSKKGTQAPLRCANCQKEGHTANYKGCEIAQNYMKSQKPPEKRRSTPTPPPPPPQEKTSNSNSHQKPTRTYATAASDATSANNSSEMSFSDLLSEIKELCKNINFKDLLTKLKHCSQRIKNVNDSTEKMLIIVETVVSIIDGSI